MTLDKPAEDEPGPVTSYPATRLTEAHVAYVLDAYARTETWRLRWARVHAIGRFARLQLDRLLRGLGWLVEWWPKLLKALIALPPLLLLLEQLGLPVVSILREWVEAWIASGDPRSTP